MMPEKCEDYEAFLSLFDDSQEHDFPDVEARLEPGPGGSAKIVFEAPAGLRLPSPEELQEAWEGLREGRKGTGLTMKFGLRIDELGNGAASLLDWAPRRTSIPGELLGMKMARLSYDSRTNRYTVEMPELPELPAEWSDTLALWKDWSAVTCDLSRSFSTLLIYTLRREAEDHGEQEQQDRED